MSRSATLENVPLGEGRFDLCLRIGELRTLTKKRGVSPPRMLRRFTEADWEPDDLIEVIRLALIGGGMSPNEALGIVERNITEGYLMDYLPTAMSAIYASLSGVENDPVGEDLADPETMTSLGSGQPISEPVPPADSVPAK